MAKDQDPRSEAEKARAALARNDAMGMAVPESPVEERPSVTPQTFGENPKAAREKSGGVEAGGVADGAAPDRQAPPSGDEDVLSRGRE